jgi:hypothetical protein
MDNKTKRLLLVVLIAIVSLSIPMMAAPVMADTCDLSMGVQCKSTYSRDETFVNRWVSNSGWYRVDYHMTLKLYDPSGKVIAKKYNNIPLKWTETN